MPSTRPQARAAQDRSGISLGATQVETGTRRIAARGAGDCCDLRRVDCSQGVLWLLVARLRSPRT